MTGRKTRVVVLCEDKQQEVFARKYLEARNIERRKVTYNTCPGGKRAGEQYVRQEYTREVQELRRRQQENIALIVIIDADTGTVGNRLQQLDQQLNQAGLVRRGDHERIALFVPKRNIETWIAFARGDTVNEEDGYPKLGKESDCAPLVQHLVNNICPRGLDEGAPVSLHTACHELQRIL